MDFTLPGIWLFERCPVHYFFGGEKYETHRHNLTISNMMKMRMMPVSYFTSWDYSFTWIALLWVSFLQSFQLVIECLWSSWKLFLFFWRREVRGSINVKMMKIIKWWEYVYVLVFCLSETPSREYFTMNHFCVWLVL